MKKQHPRKLREKRKQKNAQKLRCDWRKTPWCRLWPPTHVHEWNTCSYWRTILLMYEYMQHFYTHKGAGEIAPRHSTFQKPCCYRLSWYVEFLAEPSEASLWAIPHHSQSTMDHISTVLLLGELMECAYTVLLLQASSWILVSVIPPTRLSPK